MDLTALSQFFSGDQFLIASAFTPLQIMVSLLITFIMALGVYWMYKTTYSGVLYAQSFNITLVMTALTVNAIMIGISGNIVLSLGLVGALSIIRFRTAVKDPKDTAYLFWVITIGVINGVAYYELSVIASLFIALALLLLERFTLSDSSYILIIKYSLEDSFAEVGKILEENARRFSLHGDSIQDGLFEKIIEVRFKKDSRDSVLAKIREIQGVESCTLVSSNGNMAE